MPDTSKAREAICVARDRHRDVMGGMSMAELKLEAAGGLYRGDDLPYPEDSPVWTGHALSGLDSALEACDALRNAIVAAREETAKLEVRNG